MNRKSLLLAWKSLLTPRSPRRSPCRARPRVEALEGRVTPTTLPPGFTETLVNTQGTLSSPTRMEFAPDGRIFVLEQGGNVKLVQSNGATWTALHLNVDSAGERGLLGIAFDPNYATNHFVYLYYTNPGAGAAPWATGEHNQISRFTVNDSNPQQPTFTNEAPILDLNNLSSASNHNGGDIHFGADGMLYADAGDNVQTFALGGNTYRVSQTLANLLGKQLRIDVSKFNSGVAARDDTAVGHLIPANNPFVGTASGINQLIYVLGLRNPYSFAVQPGTGTMYINDVGENTWEEINQDVAGSNYGWSGGNTDGFGQSPPGPGTYRDPLMAYDHSSSPPTPAGSAITGGTFYPSNGPFGSAYAGKYFFIDLSGGFIRVFDPTHPGSPGTPDTSTGFASNLTTGSPADLKVDAAGNLYYLAGAGGSGAVYRIASTGVPAAPTGLTTTGVAPDQIQLMWNASSGASGYLIERSPDGTTWTQVSSTVGSNVVLTDGGLTPSTTYSYRVRAYNGVGNSGYSNVASTATKSGTVNAMFADNFDSASLNPAWSLVGGNWSQSGGMLSQTSTANGDPRKAMITGLGSLPDVMVTARVRVDSWANGDYARAGVGLYTNGTGEGYNLLFHNNTSTVQFLDDHVTWGNAYTFSWQVGTWYWFKLEEQGGVLYGKVWADGTAEPSAWMFTQAGWTDRQSSGAPALNGGDTGAGGSTASFDAVSVVNLSTPPASAPGNFTANATGAHQIDLSWSDVSGEAGFKVERSPDGQTGWAQIATTGIGVLSYTDSGLNASTTYYYRVRAYNGAGNGPYSAVASATTGQTLFSDDFNGNTIGPAWKLVGGSWSQANGALSQTSTANGDPRKAMVTNQTFPADVVITARVRVDSWANGDYARAGVGLYTDPNTGLGYNLVFHNNTNTVQFLDDHVAWGNAYTFNWQPGVWYWFKLAEQGGVLLGKVWADGTAEPTNWMFMQTGWTDRQSSGAPALNGGDTGIGGSTASFSHVTVD